MVALKYRKYDLGFRGEPSGITDYVFGDRVKFRFTPLGEPELLYPPEVIDVTVVEGLGLHDRYLLGGDTEPYDFDPRTAAGNTFSYSGGVWFGNLLTADVAGRIESVVYGLGAAEPNINFYPALFSNNAGAPDQLLMAGPMVQNGVINDNVLPLTDPWEVSPGDEIWVGAYQANTGSIQAKYTSFGAGVGSWYFTGTTPADAPGAMTQYGDRIRIFARGVEFVDPPMEAIETLALGDEVFGEMGLDKEIVETLGAGDVVTPGYQLEIVETLAGEDLLTVTNGVSVVIIDSVGLEALCDGSIRLGGFIDEALGMAANPVGNLPAGAIEAEVIERAINLLDVIVLDYSLGGKSESGLRVTDAAHPSWGKAIRENLSLTDLGTLSNFHVSLRVTDGLRFRDRTYITIPATLVEELGAGDLVSALQAIKIIERLGLTDVLAKQARRAVTVLERVRFRDSLATFFGADVVEGLGLHEALTPKLRALGAILEGLEVEAELTPLVAFRALVRESLNISDEMLLNMIWNGQIEETIDFDIGYFSAGGDYTAWTMNTRNSAVTQYENFEFNSFARIGNKYIGAGAEGIYELLGDDDAGQDIVATLRGGYMQFGGTHLSRLKAAYISVRAPNAEVYLKIITADGATYGYRVDTRSMRNTKVHMGKGMKARYFAYELVSTGQDFDLDTLEFVPLVVQRRV